MFDLLIRNGLVVDGSGAAEQRLDIGVREGVIVAMAPELGTEAGEVIDAGGRLVTPGFVDIHSHYDGQATWDELLEPSSGHGVTTIVTGNCGVGFAPVRPGREQDLIRLMEGVEDIPGAALSEGMTWGWESFPEYLDALSARRWAVDVATQIPHGAMRSYVRDGRPDDETASPEEIERMARLVREAMEAGAFGFTTSRTLGHKSLDGHPVPGTFAPYAELEAIAGGVAAGGGRVFEVAPSGLARSDDPATAAGEVEWIGRVAASTGLHSTFIVMQVRNAPDQWRIEMEEARRWRSRGASVVPLVAGRPFAVLWGWDVRHPFMFRPSYRAIAHLPLLERLERLRDPAMRDAILSEADHYSDAAEQRQEKYIRTILAECFTLTGTPDYEQPLDRLLGARAEQRGVSLIEAAYDELCSADDAMLFYPLYNYAGGDHAVLHEQLLDPDAVVGLNDGGAHCAFICDASIPTYMLTHWVRDRARGPRLTLPDAVRRLTSQPAALYGLSDRGLLATGRRADLNIVDLDALRLRMPRAVNDLPAGGARLIQQADGFVATVVAGQVTRRNGHDTGARPGRLLRRH